jgi:hypothetical protein
MEEALAYLPHGVVYHIRYRKRYISFGTRKDRVLEFMEHAPEADWDGDYVMKTK